MRGFITRRFAETVVNIGYYDMTTNEMIELEELRGNWKTTDQVLKYCKKNRKTIGIPEGMQATVLSMEKVTELRKMTLEDFYRNSEPVAETRNETATETKKKSKSKSKKKGR